MALFTGQTPASDYGCILNVGVTNGQVGLNNVLQPIQDAYNNSTPLTVSTIAFNINRSGATWSLDLVPITAAGLDINSMCNPNPVATGSSFLTLPIGNTSNRPGSPVDGMLRYNSTTNLFEGYQAGAWSSFATGGTGTVTSISAVSASSGLGITGSPITTTGTFTFTLDPDLQALATLSGDGIIARQSAGVYSEITITGTTAQIDVAFGNGVGGNPKISIDSGYAGQTSITTLGTVTTGVWEGSTITVPFGGTGDTSFTPYMPICGGLTSVGALQSMPTGSPGQVLTYVSNAVLPSWQNAPGGLIINQNTSTATLTAGDKYICDNGATLITFTLPMTAALGDTYNIRGASSGGWTIAQNAGQQMHSSSSSTTAGVTGSISSTNQYNNIEITCVVANTTFNVTVSGSPNIV